MRLILIFFSLFSIVYSFGVAQYKDVKIGNENVKLNIASGNVKVITRILSGSQKIETWDVEKKTWKDSTGKPIPSTNFSFKAPGTITIKKVTKADAGFYDYVPAVDVTEVQKNLPEGVTIDVEPMLTGIELNVMD